MDSPAQTFYRAPAESALFYNEIQQDLWQLETPGDAEADITKVFRKRRSITLLS